MGLKCIEDDLIEKNEALICPLFCVTVQDEEEDLSWF